MSLKHTAGLPNSISARSALGLAIASWSSLGLAATAGEEPKQQESTVELEALDIIGTQHDTYKVDHASSTKFTSPLRETPKSITIINEELIKDRGAASLTEVLRTVPGVTLGAGEGGTPLGDRPFIRGFEASTDIHVDGLRDLGRASHEAFNLESVEIVKGPGSAYTGRGSTGGSINLVTKKAQVDSFVAGSVTMGTDSLWRTTVDTNHYLQEQDIAFRLNAMKHEADTPGRDVAEVSRWGIAPTITWGLSGPTRVTASYYHLKSDDIPDQGHPVSLITMKPVDVDRENFYGRANRDFRETSAEITTLAVEHDFSDTLTLRNTLRHADTMQDYIMGRPVFANVAQEQNGLVGNAFRSRYVENTSLINQTDLFGEFELGGMKHSFASGLELSRETIENKNKYTGNNTTNDLQNPNPHADDWTVSRGDGQTASKFQTDVVSVYAFDTISLHEQWDLNLGLRYDDYEVKDRVPNGAKSSSNLWNYQAGIVFKPLPYGSIYLSYGTSSNPSGENTQSGGADGAGAGNLLNGKDGLDPEKSRSLELGTKWDLLNQQLSLTAAVFRTEKTNARVTDPVTGDIVLDGDQKVTGIELGATGRLTDAWSVWGGYTYLDAEVVKAGGNGANDGNQAKFIAPHSFSLWTTYALTDRWTVGAGANYMDERYMNDANTITVDDYWRYDAMVGYKVNENLDLQLNVLNLTDETIYDASHVGLFAVVAPGRSAELTANFRF
ncbi:TonB-dependent siderophore receptor [Ectopseudomonas hydrolytica]|uniref:TonB-dependent siderophore receptor n=1 Tax=Ectopseudomonas hydrolytica TaxID=2493633 RepID=A0ABY5A175_9GAMM|nr:TonB-dependent siderophore receptor [Pseudomonas hydrolytica]OCX15294.1 TonB-dependent receptor [Stutzerimonas xanthomarina]USR37664.1 TonB-dependent siderophore receptor [Pseudomonas hydrolytica]